jgi:hypothetical protein
MGIMGTKTMGVPMGIMGTKTMGVPMGAMGIMQKATKIIFPHKLALVSPVK